MNNFTTVDLGNAGLRSISGHVIMAEDMSVIFIKSKLTVGVSRHYTKVAAVE